MTRLNVRCVFLTETHVCSVIPQIIHNFKPDQEMLEKFCTSFESKSCPRYQQIMDFARTDPKQSQAIVNKIQNINTNTINAQLTFNEQVTKSFNDAFGYKHNIKTDCIIKCGDGYSLKYLILIFRVIYPECISKENIDKLKLIDF